MSQFFPSGDQSIGVSASASVIPMNIQDWFLLGLTGWISLQSKGLSRVFSNTTVRKHQFFSVHPFLWSSSQVNTWQLENHSLDQTISSNLCLLICCHMVITFLPRSKRFLISWLQSPSAVILKSIDSFIISLFCLSPQLLYFKNNC